MFPRLGNSAKDKLSQVARTSSDFCATRRNSIEMDAISHLHHTAAGYNFTPHLGTICLLRRQITRCTLQTRTTTIVKQLQGHRVISAQRAEIVSRWMLHQTTFTFPTRATTIVNQLLGHRVISALCAEIVPRWVLHHTASRYNLPP